MVVFHELSVETLVAAFVAFVAIMCSSIYYFWKQATKCTAEHQLNQGLIDELGDGDANENVAIQPQTSKKAKGRKNDQWKAKPKDVGYEHPWYVTTLKGHTADITDIDFSQDGKRLVSVSGDRTVFLWNPRDFEEKAHNSVRQVLNADTAVHCAFASDCKSVVFSMKRDNKLAVYKLIKKEDTGTYKLVEVESVDYPSVHNLEISAIGIASTGKFLMSATPDMKIVLYSLRGDVLKVLDPKMSSLFSCVLSPDGRFVATCGFTPDVFVYEVSFNRENQFQDAKKVFELKGHNSGVYAVAFNQNASIAATVSKDGYWRVFDTDIRYAQGQEAKILRQGEWSLLRGARPDDVRMALSPSGGSMAVTVGTTLKFFSTEDEKKDFPELDDIHGTSVSVLRFSSCGKWLCTAGDKYARVFRNVPDYHSTAVKLTKSLPEINGDAPRRRIQEQIAEAKKKLIEFALE